MADSLLFFIPGLFTPRVAERMPAITTAIAELRKSFVVEVKSIGKGNHQQLVDELVSALTPGCHVLTTTWEANLGLLALSGRGGVGSYTAAGFAPTMRTMRAAGMNVAADALTGHASMPGSYSTLRFFMRGAEDDRIREVARSLDAERQHQTHQSRAFTSGVDLLEQPLTLRMPVRYLRSKLDFGGTRELFLRLVPEATTARLELWPTRMQDEAAGIELAARVSEFIQDLPTSNASAG